MFTYYGNGVPHCRIWSFSSNLNLMNNVVTFVVRSEGTLSHLYCKLVVDI